MHRKDISLGPLFRCLIFAVLISVVVFEGYYIFVLRKKINIQTEELKDISVQLQLLKHERENLDEELSTARKKSEEAKDADTTKR